MSTQPLASPEYEAQLMLILGKPGGGKGTISGKILKVRLEEDDDECIDAQGTSR